MRLWRIRLAGAAIGFADTPRLNRLKHRLCSTTVDMANRWHPFQGGEVCCVCGQGLGVRRVHRKRLNVTVKGGKPPLSKLLLSSVCTDFAYVLGGWEGVYEVAGGVLQCEIRNQFHKVLRWGKSADLAGMSMESKGCGMMELNSMIKQGRRRYYVRRIVRGIALTSAVSLFVCGVLVACMRFGADVPGWVWLLCAVPWAGLLIWAWPWGVADIEIARQIDKANDFGERLSSSMSFMREGAQSEWMKVQIADTMKRLDAPGTADAFVKRAFAVEKPARVREAAILAICAVILMFVPSLVSLISADGEQTEGGAGTEVAEVYAPNLDEVSQELRQHQAEALLDAAKEVDDPELKEAAEELAEILKADREGKLSAAEFERRLAALEKKISDMAQQSEAAPGMLGAKEQKAFDQAIREAVESMTQMKEDPETKELADALEQNNYDKAADILNDLLNSTDPKDKKKLEKLAKMFGDLAKNIDPTDPELKEALKKNKDLVDKLKKEFDNDKLSAEDKKAFSDAAKKLEEAEKAQKRQQEASDKASKALNKLSKAMDNTSKSLDQKAQEANEDAQRDAQAGENKEGAPKEGQDGAQKEGQKQEGQQGAQKQAGQSQDGQQQAGQDGAQKQAGQQESADGQEHAQKRDDNGAQEGADNSSETAEEALRDAAAQKKAQENRDALKDLADKMRKDAKSSEKGDKKDDARQKNMQDFMERAKGQEKQQDAQQSGQQQGNEGQTDQQGQQGADGQQQAQQGQQGGDGQQETAQGQSQQASSGQQESGQAQLGKELGAQNGVNEGELLPEGVQDGGHDTTLGEATSMKVNLKDEKLTGMDSGSQTTSEIIESAGQQGFASEPYREVYQTYEKAAEEVLESEEVPQGYRNYVEKYFDMIRPQ